MPLETSSLTETRAPGNNPEIGGDSGVPIIPAIRKSPTSGIEITGAKGRHQPANADVSGLWAAGSESCS